jgi:hypothetical protein
MNDVLEVTNCDTGEVLSRNFAWRLGKEQLNSSERCILPCVPLFSR